jgi:hypothetical protein
LFSFPFRYSFFFLYSNQPLFKLDSPHLTNLDSTTICGENDPVLLYVHCSSSKPDPHVRIRRRTTPSGIPPVIMGITNIYRVDLKTNILHIVTGIKKEGRLPKITDERPDRSIKIIVLDLRGNTDPNPASDNQYASKFKKMPKGIWDNVQRICIFFQPNQPTDCPIQTSDNTINIYSNILNTHPFPPSQSFLPQLMPNTMMNPYHNTNNSGMYHPGMMYNNTNSMFNQSNYASVMAAAQSIVNAATTYNNMFIPANYHPHHQLLSPQPSPMLHHQQMQYIQQQQQPPQQSSPQPINTQIKRKPVQLQPKPTNYLSPQIEQRLQRKKTIPQRQPPPSQTLNKKKVRFAEKPAIIYFEREEGEDEPEDEEYDEEIVIEDDNQHVLDTYPNYYPEKEQLYIDQEEQEYYTQPYHPSRSRHTSTRPYYVYEDDEGEADYGPLWNRISRRNSKYKSRV